MITETGTVMSIEGSALWVETIRQSTCEACSAQKGCGQRLLASVPGHMARIRVLIDPATSAQSQPGDKVLIGIRENVVTLGSLQVYLVPLMLMLGLVIFFGMHFDSDLPVVLAAVFGLLLGGVLVRLLTRRQWDDPSAQPVLLNSFTGDPIKFTEN